jgi:hypothetical protein
MSRYIPLDKLILKENIRSDPDEDIGELVKSIEKRGQLEPITVEPAKEQGMFVVIYGHRRVKALRLLGMDAAEAKVRKNITTRERVFVQMTENAQRKNLTPDEWVRLFDKMRAADPSMTDEKISLELGMSHAWAYWQRRYAESRARIAETKLLGSAELAAMTDSELAMEARNLKVRKPGSGRKPKKGDDLIVGTTPPLLVFRKGKRSVTIVCRNLKIRQRVEQAARIIKDQIEKQDAPASKGKTA